MEIILSFVQLLTIVFICIYEYKKKFISVFMWATLVLMFGIPHFLSVITKISLYNDSVLYKASIFVVTFNIIYFVTKVIMDSILNRGSIKNKSNINNEIYLEKKTTPLRIRDKNMIIIFFILLLCCLLVILWVSQKYFGGMSNSSWGKFYTLNGNLGFSSPVKYSDFIFFAVAGVALVFKKYKYKSLFYISITTIVCYSIITSNRITILPAFMAFLIPVIFDTNQRLSIKNVFYFSIMAVIVVYSVYMLRLVRFAGGIYSFIDNFEFSKVNAMIFDMLLNGDGELGLRNAFYYFIDIDNNFPGFNQGATYLRLLLIAFPTRFAFGLKPPDFAITMGSAYTNNISNTSFSMHPTLFGDVFANFWWYGILLGAFWAVFSYLIGLLVNRKNYVVKSMLLVLFGTVFVIAGRGSIYNGFFLGLEGTIVISLIYLVTRLRIR